MLQSLGAEAQGTVISKAKPTKTTIQSPMRVSVTLQHLLKQNTVVTSEHNN